jgi:hypothetical protein
MLSSWEGLAWDEAMRGLRAHVRPPLLLHLPAKHLPLCVLDGQADSINCYCSSRAFAAELLFSAGQRGRRKLEDSGIYGDLWQSSGAAYSRFSPSHFPLPTSPFRRLLVALLALINCSLDHPCSALAILRRLLHISSIQNRPSRQPTATGTRFVHLTLGQSLLFAPFLQPANRRQGYR